MDFFLPLERGFIEVYRISVVLYVLVLVGLGNATVEHAYDNNSCHIHRILHRPVIDGFPETFLEILKS
jgi:hypothetical protein